MYFYYLGSFILNFVYSFCYRQGKTLIKGLTNAISKKHKVFKNVEITIIGSIKENSKIGTVDEIDMLLTLDSFEDECFEFDDENQQINAIGRVPKEFREFVDSTGKLDTTKYQNSFVKALNEVITNEEIDVPKGMYPLSTRFKPCNVCKDMDNLVPQNVRCRHKRGCSFHKQKSDENSASKNCDCKEFTSPSITCSKIGAALHLGNSCNKLLNIAIRGLRNKYI